MKDPIQVTDTGKIKTKTNVKTEVEAPVSTQQVSTDLVTAAATVNPTLKVAPTVVDTAINPMLGGQESGSSVQNMLQLDQSLVSNLRFLRDSVPRTVLRANRRFKYGR